MRDAGVRDGVPKGCQLNRRSGIVMSKDKFTAASGALGCPYGAREYSESGGIRKQHVVDASTTRTSRRPSDSRLREPPTRARHFGDLGDPASAVSKLVAERGGVALLPELGYQPVNRYLPPRPRRGDGESAEPDTATRAASPLHWLARTFRR